MGSDAGRGGGGESSKSSLELFTCKDGEASQRVGLIRSYDMLTKTALAYVLRSYAKVGQKFSLKRAVGENELLIRSGDTVHVRAVVQELPVA